MRLAPVSAPVGLPKHPDIKDEEVFFSYTEGRRTDTFELDKDHPEDIYCHKFLSMVSWSLAKGKKVIINCGKYIYERVEKDQFHPDELLINPSQVEFIVSELLYGTPAKKIHHMDDKSPEKRREIESSISYIEFNNGIFGFFRQLVGCEPPPVLLVKLEEKGVGDESSFDFFK